MSGFDHVQALPVRPMPWLRARGSRPFSAQCMDTLQQSLRMKRLGEDLQRVLSGAARYPFRRSEICVCHGHAFGFKNGTKGKPRAQKTRLGSRECDSESISGLLHWTLPLVVLTYDESVTRGKPLYRI